MRAALVLFLLLAPLVWAATSTETEFDEPNTIRDADGNDTGVTRGTQLAICGCHDVYAADGHVYPCLC
jgi:hypothetical protein